MSVNYLIYFHDIIIHLTFTYLRRLHYHILMAFITDGKRPIGYNRLPIYQRACRTTCEKIAGLYDKIMLSTCYHIFSMERLTVVSHHFLVK